MQRPLSPLQADVMETCVGLSDHTLQSMHRCGVGSCYRAPGPGPSPSPRTATEPLPAAASTYRSSDGAGRSRKSRRSLGSLQKRVPRAEDWGWRENGRGRGKTQSITVLGAKTAAPHPPPCTAYTTSPRGTPPPCCSRPRRAHVTPCLGEPGFTCSSARLP